jgi:hypothetical protein
VIILLFNLLVGITSLFSQEQKTRLSGELLAGRIVPNYLKGHPSASLRTDIALYAHVNIQQKKWAPFYNFPDVGVAIQASRLGNSQVFGNQLSFYPFIILKTTNPNKPLLFKFGLGAAYFSKFHHPQTNPTNLSVGSPLSWHFNAGLCKTIVHFSHSELLLNIGFYHASNGHTQIPNYGLNSALIGLEYRLGTAVIPSRKKVEDASSYWMLQHRSGIGFHELAATDRPVGTPKYMVLSSGFSVGYVHRDHVKYKTGIFTRFYDSFYQYMLQQRGQTTLASASNIYFMAGAEFLLGHVGIDIEGGLNLYKPFFKEFYETFEGGSNFDYWSKTLFNTRMGLNFYLFDCYGTHMWNVNVGVHINANFGQADFSDVSLGLYRRF